MDATLGYEKNLGLLSKVQIPGVNKRSLCQGNSVDFQQGVDLVCRLWGLCNGKKIKLNATAAAMMSSRSL